jgi:hypothetical protein
MFRLPQEREEYRHATNGQSYFCALTDIANEFRAHRKYDGESPPNEERFFEILRQNGVDLE